MRFLNSGIIFSVALSTAMLCKPATAEELWIVNCDGSPKIATQLTPENPNKIALKISTSGATTVLLRAMNGTTELRSEVANGIAKFDNLTPGTWKLCSEQGGNLDFAEAGPSGGETGLSAAEVALGGGAAVVAAAGFVGGSGGGSSSDPVTELNSSSDTSLSGQKAPETSAATAPSRSRGDCFVGNKVVPLSPFL